MGSSARSDLVCRVGERAHICAHLIHANRSLPALDRHVSHQLKIKLGFGPWALPQQPVTSKTAQTLLNHFSSLEQIYENIDTVESLAFRGAASIKEKLIQHREMAELSKQLATIALNVPIQADINELEYVGADREQIEPLFKDLGFTDIKDRIPCCA